MIAERHVLGYIFTFDPNFIKYCPDWDMASPFKAITPTLVSDRRSGKK
jgi:hypothetical protein